MWNKLEFFFQKNLNISGNNSSILWKLNICYNIITVSIRSFIFSRNFDDLNYEIMFISCSKWMFSLLIHWTEEASYEWFTMGLICKIIMFTKKHRWILKIISLHIVNDISWSFWRISIAYFNFFLYLAL